MQNQEELLADGEMEGKTPIQASNDDDWANFRDDDIMQQQSAIQAVEAEKIPFVGDKAWVKLYMKLLLIFGSLLSRF